MNRPTLLLVCCLCAVELSAADDDARQRFDEQVAPLLADRCFDCHSGYEPKGNLDLTSWQSVLRGGESGAALVARDADASLLWQRVRDDEMPPEKPLAEQEKELLKAWIVDGAIWGTDPIDRFRFTTARRAGYDWWSFQPVQRRALPKVQRQDWALNPIDHFILAQLETEGLEPSAEASRRVLIRRLYFDLLGIPPTFEQVSEFERDPSADAYERLVDRLLASPHYGERWARHWLDIVRYGESDGFERNMPRPNSWPYRDWVIAAFNADMPYDELARLQIAGDVVHPEEPAAIHATGFLVAGLHNTVVADNPDAKLVARHEELEDLIGTLHQTFLGLTVQCARCHDHKFDPIFQSDYYQLVAALDGVQHGEREVQSQKIYSVVPVEPPATHVLARGDIHQPGKQVSAAGLIALEPQVRFSLQADSRESERRKALAEWITHRDNPLFARVMANRLWHYHFGRGIVETPNDFGFNGGRPSHPELLDWLSDELVRSGFHLKAMHRLLVTSRTYRQSARLNADAMQRDAENRWLWRKAPQRLDAESLRDAMLLVSKQLNPAIGGPGFRDVREYFNNGTTYYEPLDVLGPECNRRTIYRFSPRGERSALLDTFDCPDPSVSTPRRQVTTTPLQALALLNNAFTLQTARQMAECARRDVTNHEDSATAKQLAEIDRVFELALQRRPARDELESAQKLTNQFGLELLCRALINTHEFVIIE